MNPQVTVISGAQQQETVGNWSHGLCGCFDNCSLCLLAFCAPHLSFATTASELHGDGLGTYIMLFFCCGSSLVWLKNRAEIRERRNIRGSTMSDCCIILFLPVCAMAQEAQEVQMMNKEKYVAERTRGTSVVVQGGGGYRGPSVAPQVAPVVEEQQYMERQ